MAFHTKYKENVVGMYGHQNNVDVRFYMNAATWDRLKQELLRARDNWETLEPTRFERIGKVVGYRIANRESTLRLNLLGSTTLSERRLMLNLTGGADKPRRVSVALKQENLKELVESFYKIDTFFRGQ